MKLIFFGTSEFAVPSLLKIINSKHELMAVVTRPDRKKGRKLIVAPPPVKAALKNKSIPLHQPQAVSAQDMVKILKGYNADLFVVVSFGQILKKELLSVPKICCINLHASLLPKYRGAAPINWAVINGDVETGVTIIRMNEFMDRGDMILTKEIAILDSDNSESLTEKLSNAGSSLLLESIDSIASGKTKFIKQDEKKATSAPKLKKEDGLIDWHVGAFEIHNRVRGLVPWPGAFTHYKSKFLKIWESGFSQNKVDQKYIGSVTAIGSDGIRIGTKKGELIVKLLQLEGGKKLGADEFLRGHKLKIGDRLQ